MRFQRLLFASAIILPSAFSLSACLPSDPLLAGIAAKTTCSGHYVSDRRLQGVFRDDIRSISMASLFTEKLTVREAPTGKAVIARKNDTERTAVYYEGFGCTLLPQNASYDAAAIAQAQPPQKPEPDIAGLALLWPEGEATKISTSDEDLAQLKPLHDVLDREFTLKSKRETQTGARGVVIVKNGQIVAERYAPGFTVDTPQLGWSMAKSVLGMLVAQRIDDGVMSLSQKHLDPSWENTPRDDITVRDLLYMRDGINTNENYLPIDFSRLPSVPEMLWEYTDTSTIARTAKSNAVPGEEWAYRSAVSNYLSSLLRRSFAHDQDYWTYPYTRLFNPIGIKSAVLETDAAGNFIASSYMYATPRDWARLGLLMLQNGEWDGQQVLPKGWVQAATSVPEIYQQKDNAPYGAHIWLTASATGTQLWKSCDLPKDGYYFSGHWGQKVAIIPSEDLVIVRLGWTTGDTSWSQCSFLKDTISAARRLNDDATVMTGKVKTTQTPEQQRQ